ncbi:flagellar biosynthetic protein FliO [Candidatus Enterovibrio escicola]|nr:flagellar biosynthetic protein FliO [Candidatus Enterovibrio escacola]
MFLAIFGLLFVPTAFSAPLSSVNIATPFVALLLVIGIIFALTWILRRLRIPSLMTEKSKMKVVSRLQLGHKEQIVILDVNGAQLLLGITTQQITFLKELDIPFNTGKAPPKTAGETGNSSSQLKQIFKQNDAS